MLLQPIDHHGFCSLLRLTRRIVAIIINPLNPIPDWMCLMNIAKVLLQTSRKLCPSTGCSPRIPKDGEEEKIKELGKR